MALLGKAGLLVWNDVDPAIEADYNEWYLREHIPERVSVPGMLRGRRYRAPEGSPRYMALYEAGTLDVLTAGAYRTQLANPTAWTRRVMPGFRLMQRGICSALATAGAGIGGAATVIHLRPRSAGETALRKWAEALLPELLSIEQVAAAHLWVAAPGEPASPTTGLTSDSAVEREVHWVLAIEASDAASIDRARDTALAADPSGNGAAEVATYPSYQLLYVLSAGG